MVNPDDFYHGIELTEDEVTMAILEAKRKKYFHVKNMEYWQNLESPKGKTKVISYLPDTEKKEYISTSASQEPHHGFRS